MWPIMGDYGRTAIVCICDQTSHLLSISVDADGVICKHVKEEGSNPIVGGNAR